MEHPGTARRVAEITGLEGRLHFAGVAGSGMSPLAQYLLLRGARISGSDRLLDRRPADPAAQDLRARMERLGLLVAPQDGSGLCLGGDVAGALIVSSAVEETTPDMRAAREHGVPILHRSELLARIVAAHRAIAVAGTSGKSTVAAMLFTILRAAGLGPSIITGADLLALRDEGLAGSAFAGTGDLLVIEADESDGSLVRYEAWAGLLLNLQRDHKEPEELFEIFRTFRRRTRGPFAAADDANLDLLAVGAIRFGRSERSDLQAIHLEPGPASSRFRVRLRSGGEEAPVELPVPGEHNIANALAALAAAGFCGVSVVEGARALARFRGVARRFQTAGQARGVEVIDDFAHNPEKIAAALRAARLRLRPGGRILAVYQPHGFGPTRFLWSGLVASLAAGLGPDDRLYLPEIFYAGGTATRDISAADLAREVAARGVPAFFRADRDELPALIAAEARPGDLVLVMGARDPSLTEFATGIVRLLEEGP